MLKTKVLVGNTPLLRELGAYVRSVVAVKIEEELNKESTENLCRKKKAGIALQHVGNVLILSRTYGNATVERIKLRIKEYKGASEFEKDPSPLNSICLLTFSGSRVLFDDGLQRIKLVLMDLFRQVGSNKLNLLGVRKTIEVRFNEKDISISVYRIEGAGESMSLKECGPRVVFTVEDSVLGELPVKVKKTKKNSRKNEIGDTVGRIYIDRQNIAEIDELRVRKNGRRA